MKILIQKILYFYSKQVLKKYKPEIIGITGSVGKTTTREAVFSVLKNNHNVRTAQKNYNTEIGVPLTILNIENAGKNLFKWKINFLKIFWNLILKTDKNFPEILVLEMAADHPGDIEYLTKLAPCKIGIVTAIGPTHMEFFEKIENLILEKEKIISHLSENSYAILNADDDLVLPMQKNTSANILTFGLSQNADIRAEKLNFENDGSGISCKIISQNETVQADFKNIISTSQVLSLLCAISVAQIYKIPLAQAVLNLQNFKFPLGRLNLIKGIKNTQIIDDTYNASPKAVQMALETLSRIKTSGRRWAILGDMLELGNFTENAHSQVGEWIKKYKIDIFVAIGERMRSAVLIAEKGENALEKEKVIAFDNSNEAKKFIQSEISENDLILVKGSRGIKMEKIVDEIKLQ